MANKRPRFLGLTTHAGLSLLAAWLLLAASIILTISTDSMAASKLKLGGVEGESKDDKHPPPIEKRQNNQPMKNLNTAPKQSNRRK
jgi:hypothetical protein